VTVAGLLLAAGAGRRLGGPKALLQVDGRTFVERGVALLRDAGCAPVVVVLGAHAGEIQPLVPADVVLATDWSEGVGASLRAGLLALEPTSATACVVTLVDQPEISVEAVRRLLAVAGDVDAAVATYAGEAGHPVLLDRLVWGAVAEQAVGDVGARAWLRSHPSRVLAVPCDGLGSARDVDTAADLALLRPGRDDGAEQQHDQAESGERDH
jgi:CTP:molybdopterin cytidylyltransferase MocA